MRIFDGSNDNDLREAGMLLRNGGVVAIPTETVYGLAADWTNPAAIARIYAVKGRPDNKPLPVLVAGAKDAERLADIPPIARGLIDRFWPGPLTLVLPMPGGKTVACRCPKHDAALAVLRYSGVPLALTSANRSGEAPPSDVSQITLPGLGGIVDGGPCAVGRPSAILDVTRDPPELLRHSAAIIGITGGSGAGKSTVMNRLRELGAVTIRADAVYHRLLQSDKEMRLKLRERFPGAFSGPDAPFDRIIMRQIAFQDPAALTDLNRLTHPHVISEIRRDLARVFLRDKDTPAAIEAIALIGSGLDGLCSDKVAVTAAFEKRVERIMTRDCLSQEDALRRIENQKKDEYYIANCNIIIENNGSLSDLIEKVDELWKINVSS